MWTFLCPLFSMAKTQCEPMNQIPNNIRTEFIEESYQNVSLSCLIKNENAEPNHWVAIRKFQIKNKTKSNLFSLFNKEPTNYYLIVDPSSLYTRLLPSSCFDLCSEFDFNKDKQQNNYNLALKAMAKAPFKMSDFGATHEFNELKNVYLTVDLCPSHQKLDRSLFEEIQNEKKNIPIAISMAGNWLNHHKDDFHYLMNLQELGKINITWINHSLTHPYDPKLPTDHNFMLKTGVDFKNEVFENEKLFIKNGIIPTVFFRFPGLISDKIDDQSLSKWGLLPIGADAWLSLGQKASIGSIILVHGNGNEPKGLKILYNLLKKDPQLKSIMTEIHKVFFFEHK